MARGKIPVARARFNFRFRRGIARKNFAEKFGRENRDRRKFGRRARRANFGIRRRPQFFRRAECRRRLALARPRLANCGKRGRRERVGSRALGGRGGLVAAPKLRPATRFWRKMSHSARARFARISGSTRAKFPRGSTGKKVATGRTKFGAVVGANSRIGVIRA